MTRRRVLFLVSASVLAGIVAFWPDPVWWGLPVRPVYHPADGRSEDLPTDLKLMWETQPLTGTPDPTHGPNPRGSTEHAISAASRVFNTVELIGKTRREVIALLGDPKTSNDSIYNFPFWPAPQGALVYRFDCGTCGWQFNVKFNFGWRMRVSEVERLWIH